MDGENKIILENSTDLYKLPISVLKNTKIYNFKGKYFDKIYEEALKIEKSGGKVEDLIKKKINIEEIELEITFATSFGQKIVACGSTPSLGSWDYIKATPMFWNEGNIWKSHIPFVDYFEFKFVLIEYDKIKKWESGSNRVFNFETIKNKIENENSTKNNDVIVVKDNNKQLFTYIEKNNILNFKCQWIE